MPRELNLPASWNDPAPEPRRKPRKKAPPRRMLEAKVKEIVKDLLKKHHAQFYMPVPGGYGVRGVHDFIGCSRGRYFTVETKAEGVDKMSEFQKDFARKVRAAEGMVFLVNGSSDGLEQLEAWLANGD